jgi:phosphoribosyl-ATP pyrophosphohydrolase/phosphoribosyl-AMP cyclohydrolase
MIVVIDPAREPPAELLDERSRDFLEPSARGLRGERDVEHDDAPLQVAGAGQLARRREGEVWARHEPLFRSTSRRRSSARCRLQLRMAPLPLKFDAQGLIPVIVQDHLTGEVRMQAFANEEAVQRTLESGRATFWSRSRGEVWEKGSTSGNVVHVLRVLVDCDADSLLYVSEPEGNSCHTGAPSCFFRTLVGPSAEGLIEVEPEKGGAPTLLGSLEATLEARKGSTSAASYTKSLFDGGGSAIGAKLREEGGELAHALEAESDDRVVSESADVLYHLLVGLRWRNIGLKRVLAELARRLGTSGHAEKAARSPTR